MFLLCNLILLCQKNIKLNSKWFQTNESLNKFVLIIHQILTLKTLWIFTKKYAAKPYSFLVTDATLASDNLFTFQKNFCLEKIYKLNMTFHDNIGDEKVQYDINIEEAKISGLIKEKW